MAFLVESCGEMLVSVSTHKPVPAPFLTKTYQLVDDPCTDHIVSWGEDNTAFVVWKLPEFARDLLPKYFKHNNFSSFVRQLNTYGFRKTVADRWEFANEFFRKGEKELLSEIHRRKSHQIIPQHFHHHHDLHHRQQQQHYFHCSSFQYYPDDISSWVEPPPPLSTGSDTAFLSALSEDNQRLRKKNSLLLSELTHMKKLYTEILHFLQSHVSTAPPYRHGRLLEMDISSRTQPLPGPRCWVTIKEEEEEETDCTVKLFGVPIHGKEND